MLIRVMLLTLPLAPGIDRLYVQPPPLDGDVLRFAAAEAEHRPACAERAIGNGDEAVSAEQGQASSCEAAWQLPMVT
jgi:hypothetical protein